MTSERVPNTVLTVTAAMFGHDIKRWRMGEQGPVGRCERCGLFRWASPPPNTAQTWRVDLRCPGERK